MVMEQKAGSRKHTAVARILFGVIGVFVAVVLIALLPILFSGSKPCVYDDALLGLDAEKALAGWSPVRRNDTDDIAIEHLVYELWERGDEQMVAVFQHGVLCDYMIRNLETGTLRGSVSSEYGTLSTWLRMRFGTRNTDEHYYDVGSGTVIDSWLTNDGRIVVWWDSAETMVHDAFTLKNVAEYSFLTGLNYILNLPYSFVMFLLSFV